jgi:hypothetical protein
MMNFLVNFEIGGLLKRLRYQPHLGAGHEFFDSEILKRSIGGLKSKCNTTVVYWMVCADSSILASQAL